MTTPSLRLIYGHDTLCGWCYGFGTALDAFRQARPDIDVELVPGGLMTGPGARPYVDMASYIAGAEVQLEAVTGRKPSSEFHAMITAPNGPIAESAVPAHAILQIEKLVPGRAVEFAHLLQEAHFGEGQDLNDPNTYRQIIADHGFPQIDVDAALHATNTTPLVAASFAKSAALGVTSYPTMIVVTDAGEQVAVMRPEYDPAAFIAQFDEIGRAYEINQRANPATQSN